MRSTRLACFLPLTLSIAAISPARLLADEPSVEGKYLSHPRQVTSGFKKAGEGYFSPDGGTIIYQAVP
ncbi:MAG: hypothetical protein K8T25_17060, partial [Planctomycetia bacterium]|nr:hypothetical protein [Planctomycetia bacterium]